MIAKKTFFIIIFIYFFQYVRERNLNYFNFLKVSKKNVLMHRPSIKKSVTSTTLHSCIFYQCASIGKRAQRKRPACCNSHHQLFFMMKNTLVWDSKSTHRHYVLFIQVSYLGIHFWKSIFIKSMPNFRWLITSFECVHF